MKNVIIIILCIFTPYLMAQESKHYDIINQSIKTQIEFELKSSPSLSQKNVYVIDKPLIYSDKKGFTSLKNFSMNDVEVMFLSSKELKQKSKKGISLLKVYPLRIDEENGLLYVLIEMVNAKRKQHTLIGKSTYYFKYDCNKNKYLLDSKVQNMI